MLTAKDKYRITRKIQRRLLSISLYIHNLRQCYSKVIAVGIRLTYKMKFQQDITVDDFLQHLNKLENNTRSNKIFQHVIGYVLKIELEPKYSTPYIHGLIFLNGSYINESNMYYHGIQIVRYWSKHISNYQGSGSVVTGKEHFYNGLGLLDNRKYEILRRTYIQYLCKKEDRIVDSQGRQVRGLRKGIIQTSKTLGRPRKHKLPDLPYFLIHKLKST